MKRKKTIIGCLILTVLVITAVGFSVTTNTTIPLDLKLPKINFLGLGDGELLGKAPTNCDDGGLDNPTPPATWT